MVATITASLICYLLGSLNTAIIVGWLRGIDIRAVGTKNAGATNAWHSIGKKEGFIIGAIDFIKGVSAAWWGTSIGMPVLPVAAVVVGHNWPIFFKFSGGRGVAAAIGAASWLSPLAIVVGAVPLLTFFIYRASGAAPFFMLGLSALTGWVIYPGAITANLVMIACVYLRRVQTNWREIQKEPRRNHLLWDLFLYDRATHPKESFVDVVFG
ncbi:MAG: hypothetical protein A2806_03905 [Candidatus Terrybacteria bacterium RIFCSPHIGHO2_01_FULL_48_17]|uniref:Glycerol-3-phosphate acyltransferase n=1 Tax=Candidatus Terrybacteria bacterium RIFCSPHIGHO2_01_FULL_48_17 TaxID=1802362 RepID=A0A1G2PKL1_9BACT|nr:MAG: hypothetical protein A2806_03905 [Candidatus Terrybacteria bacterium RIFCSPHIGHO2_01_FULL_48_17]